MTASTYNASELAFLNEYSRQLLTEWAVAQIRGEQIVVDPLNEPFLTHARNKGWISSKKEEPIKVLGIGFKTAASFLKR